MKEIEYKFLIKSKPKCLENNNNYIKIIQYYYDKNIYKSLLEYLKIPDKTKSKIDTLRLRIETYKDKTKYVLNAKTKGKKERFEFEKVIDEKLANELKNCENLGKIAKKRWKIKEKYYIFEFDEYLQSKNRLLVCEVEVTKQTDNYKKIVSILNKKFNIEFEDITYQSKYKNSNLAKENLYENNKWFNRVALL